MPELHVDPALGMAGIAFATGIQAMFVYYPKRLVSKLTYRPAGYRIDEETVVPTAQIWIYTHQLPWVRPATRPAAVVPVTTKTPSSSSSSSDDPLAVRTLVDPISDAAMTIVNDLRGDIQKFEGILAIKNPAPSLFPWKAPFFLDFGDGDSCKVPSPGRLVRALLYPEQLALSSWDNNDEYDDYYHDDDDDDYDGVHKAGGTRYRHRRRSSMRPSSSSSSRSSTSSRRKESRLRKIARHRRHRR